jgi:hypothetical protein
MTNSFKLLGIIALAVIIGFSITACSSDVDDSNFVEDPNGNNGEDLNGGEGENPNGGEGEDPNGGEGEDPNGGEGEDPNGGEGEDPNGGEGEDPNGGEGEDPNGGEGEDPNSGEGEDPNGGEGEDPNGGEGEDPNGGDDALVYGPGSAPEGLFAQWYGTQEAADAGGANWLYEFKSDGTVIIFGDEYLFKVVGDEELYVITADELRSNPEGGVRHTFTLDGTELTISSETVSSLVGTFYKEAE